MCWSTSLRTELGVSSEWCHPRWWTWMSQMTQKLNKWLQLPLTGFFFFFFFGERIEINSSRQKRGHPIDLGHVKRSLHDGEQKEGITTTLGERKLPLQSPSRAHQMVPNLVTRAPYICALLSSTNFIMWFLCAMVSLQALWQMRSAIMLSFLKINLHQAHQMCQMIALPRMSQARSMRLV